MAKEQLLELSITHLNAKGRGCGTYPLAPHQESAIEVIGALPGDRARVKLFKKRRGKWSADLLELIAPSSERTLKRCMHAPSCGGCAWQELEYASQLKVKQERLEKLFSGIAKEGVIQLILPCQEPWEYRNKMEFSFSQNKAGERFLGLVIAGSRGHVFNLHECHLVSPWFSRVVASVRSWWEESGLLAYRMNDTGALRTLVVREGKRTQGRLVMLTVSGNPDYALKRSQLDAFVEAVKRTTPEELWPQLSVFLRIQQLQKGRPTQFYEMHLFGPDHLEEQLIIAGRTLRFKVSPTAFFQPNTLQAERLFQAALECSPTRKKHVLDLYAGTATLSIVLAPIAEKITAIELNPHACFDAEVNREYNAIAHLTVVCGDVGKKLKELRAQEGFVAPDLVVVDPPRTGLDAQALSHLKELAPKEILYISCNPSTQAPQLKELIDAGYELVTLLPVDQFPHTVHVETIALLKKALDFSPSFSASLC